MKKTLLSVAAIAMLVSGCGGESEPAASAPANAAPAMAGTAVTKYEIPMTTLEPLTLGPYTVEPMYEEELSDGHFNIRITGGEVAAVREWVGPEDASGVVIVKTEIENDYHHGHVEMPNPIPADARLWIEIETPAGERLKGSVALQP